MSSESLHSIFARLKIIEDGDSNFISARVPRTTNRSRGGRVLLYLAFAAAWPLGGDSRCRPDWFRRGHRRSVSKPPSGGKHRVRSRMARGLNVFGFRIELGVGAWVFAGAFPGGACGAFRRWWITIPAMLLGLVAGLLAEMSRYLTVLVPSLRGFDMQLLLLLCAGLFLNTVAALVSPPIRRAYAGS